MLGFKVRLSAAFMLCALALASAIPMIFGIGYQTLFAGLLIIVASTFLVEKAPTLNRRGRRALHAQFGKVGEDEPNVKDVVLAALKEHNSQITDHLKKIDDEIKTHGKVSEETKGEMVKLTEANVKLNARLNEVEQLVVQPKGEGKGKELTAGQKFVKSDQLKEYATRGAKGSSGRMSLKNITSVSGSAGAGVWSDRLMGVVQDPLMPVAVRALCDNGTTGSNLIEWIRENVFTNNAAMQSEGGLKAQSEITYERADVPVRTIAHFCKATKQILADFPQLQTLIDGRLTQGLKIKEDSQLLNGDGTGDNILGLIPQATSYDPTLNKSGDTRVDTLRRAILQVRLRSYYPCTGIALNPSDWADIELLKDTQGRYLFGLPGQSIAPTLWGLPVAESFELGAGEFLVGSFKLAATVFDREDAGVYLSSEDGDNFVRNMVTVLAEERLALAVSRPKAFVQAASPANCRL